MSHHSNADPLSLIEMIYAAPLGDVSWRALLGALKDFVGADLAFMWLKSKITNNTFIAEVINIDISYVSSYRSYYKPLNPYLKPLEKFRENKIIFGEEIIERRQLMKTEFFNDFMRPQDMYSVMGGIIINNPTMIAVVSFYRGQERPIFSEEARISWEFILPHLRRSCVFFHSLADRENSILQTRATLEHHENGVFLLDGYGKTLWANPRAEDLLEKQDGIQLKGGIISLHRPHEDGQLRRLISLYSSPLINNGASENDFLLVSRPSGKQPFVISVTPLRSERVAALASFSDMPTAVVFVTDPDAELDRHVESLRRIYRLTGAEAKIVLAIAQGGPLAEAAERMGITLNTAKTQLKRVMEKTGATRQAELIKLLLRMPANFRR
jgi:DNA-binding CsgD family transcriptional regulator